MKQFVLLCAVGMAAASFTMLTTEAQARTLRIVSYNIDCADQSSDNNITGATHSAPTVVQAIGLHHLGTNTQPVDVMSCEELTSTTLANFVAQLNSIYGAGTYAFDPTTDPSPGGGGPEGIIYRTNTVQVVSARALPTGTSVLLQANGTYTTAHSPGGGTKGVPRAPMVYQLQPIGSGTNNDFYFYVSHARSTSDDAVGDARYAEAQEVRSDAKYKLPAGAHILYGGDWNLFNGSYENAYKCLTGQTTSDGINWSDTSAIWANTNQTQAYDPISKTVPPTTFVWTNSATDIGTYLYTDATDAGTYAMSSRIDIQLPNALMFAAYNTNGGVQLAPDTADPYDISNFPAAQYPYAFETFGNNGSTPRGSVATSSSNHSLNDLASTVPNAATVYADLQRTGSGSSFTGSDHYPIVGDYNIVPPPIVLTCSSNLTGTATGTNGAVVFFTVTASGGCSPPPSVVANPPSGSTFPIGITTVTSTASDNCGDTNDCSFTVTVVRPPIVLTCSSNLTVAATGTNGAVVFFTVTASGGCSPPPSVVANPPSGSTFPIGTTTVTSTASDTCGGTNNCSFTVTVNPLVYPPLALAPQGFGANGNFQFQLSSATNTGVGIQASMDLASWTNIGSGTTGTNGLLLFQDTNTASSPYRFYRVYWPFP